MAPIDTSASTTPAAIAVDAATSVTAADAKASRLARHMQSEFTAAHIYSADRIQRATLPNAKITLAYVVHKSSAAAPSTSAALASAAFKNPPAPTRVVLLMGYSHRKEEWAPTVDAMIAQYEQARHANTLEILSLDNRGVGDSDAPWGRYTTTMMANDTLELLDHLGWTRAHIVGTSMGGMIAQELALAAPQRVSSLSLVVSARRMFCPATSTFSAMWTEATSSDPEVFTSTVLACLYPTSFLDVPCGDSGKTMRSVAHAYHKDGTTARGRPTTSGNLGQAAALVLHYVSDARLQQLRDSGFPILVVGARHDACIDVSHSEYFARVLASDHVRTVMYEDAGHGVFLQHVDEVARDVLDVVQRGTTQ